MIVRTSNQTRKCQFSRPFESFATYSKIQRLIFLPRRSLGAALPSMLTNSSTDMAFPADHLCPATSSRLSPWLAPIMYGIGEKIILPAYFSKIQIIGAENIPTKGPVVLAPTHQSRWDSLLVGLLGKNAGRYLRFMVTADECLGIQGWFIRRLGGFPVHVRRPSIKTLRHGVQLLREQEMMVIYPEGDIYQDGGSSAEAGAGKDCTTGRAIAPQPRRQNCTH